MNYEKMLKMEKEIEELKRQNARLQGTVQTLKGESEYSLALKELVFEFITDDDIISRDTLDWAHEVTSNYLLGKMRTFHHLPTHPDPHRWCGNGPSQDELQEALEAVVEEIEVYLEQLTNRGPRSFQEMTQLRK